MPYTLFTNSLCHKCGKFYCIISKTDKIMLLQVMRPDSFSTDPKG